jgi:hypothetical protein
MWQSKWATEAALPQSDLQVAFINEVMRSETLGAPLPDP